MWLEGYDDGEFERPYAKPWQDAQEAVRHIGTNAIPSLLRMMRAEDSVVRRKLRAGLGRFSFLQSHFVTAERRHFEAMRGFRCLGPCASNAVPALIEIFKHARPGVPAGNSSQTAFAAFGGIGPAARDAVPLLLQWVRDPDPAVRRDAIATLGEIHAQASFVVPVLAQSTTDTNAMVRWATITALSNFGPQAGSAVPVLLQAVKDPDKLVSNAAVEAIYEIDPGTAARAGLAKPKSE